MAFTGTLVTALVGPSGHAFNLASFSGLALATNAGAPDVTASDSGGFTTDQTPPANYESLPANFGPGEGNWDGAAVDRVRLLVQDTLTPSVLSYTKSLVSGNLDIVILNTSATTPVTINGVVIFQHSLSG